MAGGDVDGSGHAPSPGRTGGGGGEERGRGLPDPGPTLLLVLGAALLFLVGGVPLRIVFGEGGLLLAQILFLLVPALVFLRAGGYDLGRCLPPRLPRPGEVGSGVLLLAGGIGIAWFLAWAQSFVIPVPVEYLEALEAVFRADSLRRYLWLLLMVALVPAVAEEVLFRGAVLSGFRSRLPDGWAIVLAGVVFGIFHLSPATAFRILPTAWLGVVLGWVVVVSRSLPLAMVLHFVNNAAILTLTAIPETREALQVAEERPPLLVLPGALVLLALGARGLTAGGQGDAGPGPEPSPGATTVRDPSSGRGGW